jgi:hypothetical protein
VRDQKGFGELISTASSFGAAAAGPLGWALRLARQPEARVAVAGCLDRIGAQPTDPVLQGHYLLAKGGPWDGTLLEPLCAVIADAESQPDVRGAAAGVVGDLAAASVDRSDTRWQAATQALRSFLLDPRAPVDGEVNLLSLPYTMSRREMPARRAAAASLLRIGGQQAIAALREGLCSGMEMHRAVLALFALMGVPDDPTTRAWVKGFSMVDVRTLGAGLHKDDLAAQFSRMATAWAPTVGLGDHALSPVVELYRQYDAGDELEELLHRYTLAVFAASGHRGALEVFCRRLGDHPIAWHSGVVRFLLGELCGSGRLDPAALQLVRATGVAT